MEVEENREAFERLRQDPNFKDFFSFPFPDLKVGKKIKSWHGDSKFYEGEFTLGTHRNFPCALKVFRGSESLSKLRERWPEGMLKGGNSVFPGYSSGTSSILGGLLLPDGRFAMVLRREWGDLRKLIDLLLMNKRKKHMGRVFSDGRAKKMMYEIAVGMRQLHSHGILHRDLKSMNVLVCTPNPSEFPKDIDSDAFTVKVIGFEDSVGVFAPRYWRAPEILQAFKDGNWMTAPVSTKSDVYSYAMTCYEILTGQRPFRNLEYRGFSDFIDIIVVEGRRPELPCGVDEWLKELIQQCWAADPSQRPEFKGIVKVFEAHVLDPRIHIVKEQIVASKFFWTAKDEDGDAIGWERKETNQEIFARLKQDPNYSSFFSYTFHNLEPKLKIAQGGQAEIFEAEFEKENGVKVPCVLKIFDSDFSLSQMVNHWPPGMLRSGGDSSEQRRFGFMGLYPGATRTCEILGAVVLSDEFGGGFADRFAFILNREAGDLRRLIDLRMKQHKNKSPPFTIKFATRIMHEIALGMQHLHDNDILHRDLKAANVLVTNVFGEFPTDVNDEIMDIKVADFECSMLVVGTKFWRAPEILRQLRSGKKEREYTRKADVYSYGMTCYEVLTGGVPLEDRGFWRNDYEAVYRGERPILPGHIEGWLRALVERCWHSEPSERPEFKEIIAELERKCSFLRDRDKDPKGSSEGTTRWWIFKYFINLVSRLHKLQLLQLLQRRSRRGSIVVWPSERE